MENYSRHFVLPFQSRMRFPFQSPVRIANNVNTVQKSDQEFGLPRACYEDPHLDQCGLSKTRRLYLLRKTFCMTPLHLRDPFFFPILMDAAKVHHDPLQVRPLTFDQFLEHNVQIALWSICLHIHHQISWSQFVDD